MAKKPNVVLVITDQQRAEFTKREGFSLDTMPFVDHLAENGAWFDNAYTAAPICVAARVSLLTGRYPNSTHVTENRGAEYAYYTQDLFDVMRSQGYKTAMVGKNHTHVRPGAVDYCDYYYFHGGQTKEPEKPEYKEFDAYLKTLNGCVSDGPTPFPLECQMPHRIVSKAIDWVDSLTNTDSFCLFVAFPEPHNPYQVPEPYYSMFPEENVPPFGATPDDLKYKGFKWKFSRQLGLETHNDYDAQMLRSRARYLGMMRLLDDQIKRLFEHLENTGKMEDTIFVFLSDHGDLIGDFGMVRKGPEMPNILMRIPLQFYGKGIKADVMPRRAFVSITDILPTLCEAIGVSLPDGVQGKSLWPILTGMEYPEKDFECAYAEHGYGGMMYNERDEINFDNCLNCGKNGTTFDSLNTYSQCGTTKMLRKDKWILTIGCDGEGRLYDLEKDPFELNNLFDKEEFAQTKNALVMDLMVETLRHTDPLPYPNDPYRIKLHPRNYWYDEKFVKKFDHTKEYRKETF